MSTNESDNESYESSGGSEYKYISIVDTNYKKPRNGTRQDNLTKDEIKQKLEGYIALKTKEDKKILLELTPYKIWIRYYNITTKQFRVGGLLQKVDSKLRYIKLINTNDNIIWSVQVKDNIIFIQDPEIQEMKAKQKLKDEQIKEKLYKLYKKGKISIKK